ncbi:MAG: M48 family metallopeptidase [Thermodesulfobacteriota bacterium]
MSQNSEKGYRKLAAGTGPVKLVLVFFFLLFLVSCEEVDVGMIAGAGIDAVKAVTLSDEQVVHLARQASSLNDRKNRIAPADHPYSRRLRLLVGDHLEEDGYRFNYKVYLTKQVNAFAMADGTIRIYSGLMEMMDDGELRFIIGHEMGHVVNKHIKKKMMLAYGGSALRKAIGSQDNLAGEISRSALGGFLEVVMGAQFSQQEEREADDYGLNFLRREKYEKEAAISALRKLATLGADHSFLSSHPAPDKRADRLEGQLVGSDPDSPSLWQRLIELLLLVWYFLKNLIGSFF